MKERKEGRKEERKPPKSLDLNRIELLTLTLPLIG
jgi:hypothetical protein